MKRPFAGSFAVVALMLLSPLGVADARADDPTMPNTREASGGASSTKPPPARAVGLQTWGQGGTREPLPSHPEAGDHADLSSLTSSSPVRMARDSLTRARRLDDRAAADEKVSNEIQQRLPALRASAKATRERAERANGADREVLVAVAEDLETDLAISEVETTSKKREAEDGRRTAHELRVRAMRIIHGRPTDSATHLTADGLTRDSSVDRADAAQRDDHCDPPFRFTPDGRKTYLFECLK